MIMMRRRACALAMALLMALALPGAAQSPKITNEFCPILPDRKALPEHWSEYKGRRIYFCCEDCKQAFDADPESVALPPATPDASPEGHVHGPGYAEWAALVGGKEDVAEGNQDRGHLREILISGFVFMLSGLLVARRRGVLGKPIPKQAFGAAAILILWTLPWVFLWRSALDRVGYLEAKVESMEPLRKQAALSQIHFATFSDYGSPPRPRRSPLSPRLSATYYRGNDERSARLFNGGHYRTATFNISVRDASGVPKPGDALSGSVIIRIEIVRAPFTPDYFYSKERLAQIYVTADAAPDAGSRGPIADRTPLVETEPGKRWTADYPLGPVETSTSGILYIREQFADGARFHFAVQYDLRLENGRLGKESDLFMGSLYRTRSLSLDALPPEEWFSHLPIPEKPSAGTTDAKLLGIDVDKRPFRR